MPASSSFKHRIKEQEDYIRDWTAHREEIARLAFIYFLSALLVIGGWREVTQQLNAEEKKTWVWFPVPTEQLSL